MRKNEPTQGQTFRRRVILIKRSLQVQFALMTMTLVSLACFMVWWETYRNLSGLVSHGFLADPMLMIVLQRINNVVLVKVIALTLLVGGFCLMISHFVAGPIYRIEKSLEHIRGGDLTHRVHLRERDALKNMGNALNHTLDEFHARLKKDYAKLNAVEKELTELSHDLHDKTKTSKVQHIAAEIKAITRSFKLNED